VAVVKKPLAPAAKPALKPLKAPAPSAAPVPMPAVFLFRAPAVPFSTMSKHFRFSLMTRKGLDNR
jgi:hypothetical protein